MTGRASDAPAPHVLREYAVIADGERAALVGPQGDCAWMCFPSWESPSVFSGLVGGAGHYVVRPADEWRVWGGYYEDRSLIWRSRWVTGDGVVECREALARPGRRDRVIVLRQIRAVRGAARVQVRLDARAGFGGDKMTGLRCDDGVWSARSGRIHLRWWGAGEAKHQGELCFFLDLAEGQTHDLMLEMATAETGEPLDANELWAATEADWRESVPDCGDTVAPRDAELAYAVLTGLTSQCGGMVAAATTSLPERMGDDRNYDYRYAWIRDQCYAGQAIATHGARAQLLDASVGFVAERILADGDDLKPAYTVEGGPVPGEEHRDLPGYPGSDVVTGNRVRSQFQLDALGEALSLFAAAARVDRMSAEAEQATRTAVRVIADRWQRPDAGIWETHDNFWTQSRLAAVGGLKAAASTIAAPSETGEWLALAEKILAETTRTCLSPSGYWRRAADDDRVDASLLVPPIRGALAADDPRTIATLARVRDRLVQDGFVYRYQIDERPLGDAEGAFMLCGFFLALAQHQQGDLVGAARTFERVRSGCSTTGLFTEEYDTRQRQLRANLPQAFVHAIMLESATRLATDP